MIGCTYRIKYNKIINPIIFFGPFVIIQYIIHRIGGLNGYFYPNALQDASHGGIIKNYFLTGQYVGVFGIIPEILFLGDFFVQFVIDVFFWMFLDKRRKMLIN